MNEDVQGILKEYINNVNEVCNLLIKAINISDNLKLKNKYDFFDYRTKCKKMEFEFSGISYILHVRIMN